MKQLQELKFCRVRFQDKKPFESDWVNKPYTYEEIQKFIPNENYGVLCGYEDLIIIDCDEPELTEAVLEKLPNTFRVETGSGGLHHYFFCPELKEKIVLTNGKHYGEVQNKGSQCVAPGSLHPNGKKYVVISNSNIATITKNELIECIKPFRKEEITFSSDKIIEKEEWIKQFIEDIIPKWKEGNRQELALSSAGYLRKNKELGFDSIKNIITIICNLTEDKEINMRLEAVKRTFMKDEKDVKGISGLKEVGLKQKIFNFFGKDTNFIETVERFYEYQPFYYDSFKNWWMWRGEEYRWERIDEIDLLISIDELTNLPHTEQKIKGQLLEAFKRVGRKKKPIEPKKSWIQFKDMIVDIKTGEKFNASAKYFIFNPIPWSLGYSKDTPIIDELLKSWVYKKGFQEENYFKTLKQIIAYCFLADMPIHRIFCLIGEGLNGKGTFLRLIENFIGEHNKTSTEIEFLTQSNFESSKLYRKLICTIGEIDKGVFKRTKTIKALSGDDLIRGEFKGKDSFDFHNYAKILISTNHLPETKDKARGFYRRWTIVNFPNEFKETENILERIPEYEYNNFCLQSIDILKNLLDKGEFENDGTINDREKRYEKHSNDIKNFIMKYYEIDENSSIEFSEFSENYNEYLISEGRQKKSKVEIGRIVDSFGFKRKYKKVDINAFTTTKLYIFGIKQIWEGLVV